PLACPSCRATSRRFPRRISRQGVIDAWGARPESGCRPRLPSRRGLTRADRTTALGGRAFFRGAAGTAASALAVRLALRAREALGAPIVVPEDTRTVEAGLAAFAAKWEVAGPVILLSRFGRFLSNKIFNCRIADTTRSYVLNLGAAGATLTPGLDPYAHAELVLEENDWLGVLFGDHTGLAPALAGRFHPSRDTANRALLLGIVMFIFAYVPAGANPDRDLRRLRHGARDQGRAGGPVVARERPLHRDREDALPHLDAQRGDDELLPRPDPRVGGLDVPRALRRLDRPGRARRRRAGAGLRTRRAHRHRRRQRDPGARRRRADGRGQYRERARRAPDRDHAGRREAARPLGRAAPGRARHRVHAAADDLDHLLDGGGQGHAHRVARGDGRYRRPLRPGRDERQPHDPREPPRLRLPDRGRGLPAAARAHGRGPGRGLALRRRAQRA